MAKIPVHVVTGFLGSGKTTFLKEILTNQALNDIALVINELGEVSLDINSYKQILSRSKLYF